MDALKKAEQEKKEAAKRLKEAQEKSGGQIQLQEEEPKTKKSSVSNKQQSKAENHEDKSQDEKKPDVTPEKKTTTNLSLSPLDETAAEPVTKQETSAEKPAKDIPETSLSLESDITIDHPAIPDLDDDTDFEEEIILTPESDKTFGIDSLSIAETTTEPFEETDNVPSQEKHEDTISDSRISRTVVSAADLVRDMGGGKEAPTPVAAQTVFRASIKSSSKQQLLEWGMFVGLLTIILIAAGTFYYLKITPLTPETFSPLVAKGVEREQSPSINVPTPEQTETKNLSGEIRVDKNLPEDTVVSDETTSTTAGTVEKETDIAEKPVQDEMEQKNANTSTENKDVIEEPAIAKVDTSIEQKSVQENNLPEKIQVDADAIAISRSKSIDKKDQLINSAYNSYIAGDYARAESEYRDVLKQNPDNRDALLGVAAIAYRKGNIQSAYANYLAVLKLYPKDIAAKTALVSLQQNADPIESESIIKLMIQEDPGTAYLYFTLGNLYAKQSRWADAQQAFFNAYRLQSDNSDYAYNLAVSLDHIGQANASKKYYAIALDLADESQSSFNTASVIARLNTLSSISNSE